EAAVLVVSHDHHHVFPLRTLLQVSDHVGYVGVAGLYVRVAGVFVQISLRLVEDNLFKGTGVNRLDKFGSGQSAVLQMLRALRAARGHGGEEIEWLVMKLEIGNGTRAPAGQRFIPRAG